MRDNVVYVTRFAKYAKERLGDNYKWFFMMETRLSLRAIEKIMHHGIGFDLLLECSNTANTLLQELYDRNHNPKELLVWNIDLGKNGGYEKVMGG